jgi:hypothetical protein
MSIEKFNKLLEEAALDGFTNEQKQTIKDASYKVSDAYHAFKELNEEMKANKQWGMQPDIAAIVKNLFEMTETQAGSVGYFLEKL